MEVIQKYTKIKRVFQFCQNKHITYLKKKQKKTKKSSKMSFPDLIVTSNNTNPGNQICLYGNSNKGLTICVQASGGTPPYVMYTWQTIQRQLLGFPPICTTDPKLIIPNSEMTNLETQDWTIRVFDTNGLDGIAGTFVHARAFEFLTLQATPPGPYCLEDSVQIVATINQVPNPPPPAPPAPKALASFHDKVDPTIFERAMTLQIDREMKTEETKTETETKTAKGVFNPFGAVCWYDPDGVVFAIGNILNITLDDEKKFGKYLAQRSMPETDCLAETEICIEEKPDEEEEEDDTDLCLLHASELFPCASFPKSVPQPLTCDLGQLNIGCAGKNN